MKVVRTLDEIPQLPKPIALTIGTFDGLHLGHQMLIEKTKELAGAEGSSALLTFTQHPYEVLSRGTKIPMLTPIDEKITLFEGMGIDLLILLDFTGDFADTPYETFIKQLRSGLPFSHLILGDDASLGKNREGNMETLPQLGEALSFTCHFLEKKKTDDGVPISSKRIRSLIQMGKFHEANALMGRPYSVMVTPEKVKEPQDEDLGDHALLCAFINQARLPNKSYRVRIGDSLEGYAVIAGDEAFDSDRPAYMTLYTSEPLDPENPLSITFTQE